MTIFLASKEWRRSGGRQGWSWRGAEIGSGFMGLRGELDGPAVVVDRRRDYEVI